MEDQDTFLQLPEKRKISIYRDFYHDFTSALLVSQNKKKQLVVQTSLNGS